MSFPFVAVWKSLPNRITVKYILANWPHTDEWRHLMSETQLYSDTELAVTVLSKEWL